MNVDEGYFAISHNGIRLDALHYYEDYHFECWKQKAFPERINPGISSADPESGIRQRKSSGYALTRN
jgi:hypothetical protein